jgi:hypothetical protein
VFLSGQFATEWALLDRRRPWAPTQYSLMDSPCMVHEVRTFLFLSSLKVLLEPPCSLAYAMFASVTKWNIKNEAKLWESVEKMKIYLNHKQYAINKKYNTHTHAWSS